MPRVQAGSLPAADEALGGNRLELIIYGRDRGLGNLALGFGELKEFVSGCCQLQLMKICVSVSLTQPT